MHHPIHESPHDQQPPAQRAINSNTILIVILVALVLTVIGTYYWYA